jgi:hypothetical protein
LNKGDDNLTNKEFIELIAPYAVADMKKNKILASITIAQACIETGYGKSSLMMSYNAPFGVKASDSWIKNGGKAYSAKTGEVYSGVSVTVTAAFRAYNSLAEAVEDHANVLKLAYYNKSKGGAVPYDIIGETDYKKAAECLSPYATGEAYVKTVKSTIELHSLTQYDNSAPIENVKGDELMSKEYDELKKMIDDLSAENKTLKENLNKFTDNSKIKYAWLDANFPAWAKNDIQTLIDKKILNGIEFEENGKKNIKYQLSDDMIRLLVILGRATGILK